ncbi:hypothetical protein Y032_0010g871 [Ancylostoma ceylanicum]|uniref:Uncharacterized protein n=1 Tax=Ancylostoma ceylanicum TaxID=53326 RepID=A0A016VG87_9BILA|nr:hypothetical protein Y032_0010g871 [Ancylostoma ceylanicum]
MQRFDHCWLHFNTLSSLFLIQDAIGFVSRAGSLFCFDMRIFRTKEKRLPHFLGPLEHQIHAVMHSWMSIRLARIKAYQDSIQMHV